MSEISATRVDQVFESYPASVQKKLKALRKLILATARKTEGVGELEETLKWGEPAYLTNRTKSGSTIRIGWKKSDPDHYAMYLNCQTTLVDSYRTLHPDLTYDGNRAVVFHVKQALPKDAVAHCIEMALTYHLNKRKSKAR